MINNEIAEFAWRVKNDLRPRGLLALGLPCQLMGTGMAFPRKALAAAELATGHLAEDLDLGLQLAIADFLPLFCPAAMVRSEFPATAEASAVQRQRWEHGHLAVLATRVLPAMWIAIRRADWRLLALSLDAAVPPLVLLGLLLVATLAASSSIWLFGQRITPLMVCATGMVFFSTGLVLAWLRCGRDLLTLRTVTSAVPYLAAKYAIYARAFVLNKKWQRTSRRKSD
jgi:cellulose synthase/poly-beta-1,6-N-acetylglucosamine synthase-like glycosyltransferase